MLGKHMHILAQCSERIHPEGTVRRADHEAGHTHSNGLGAQTQIKDVLKKPEHLRMQCTWQPQAFQLKNFKTPCPASKHGGSPSVVLGASVRSSCPRGLRCSVPSKDVWKKKKKSKSPPLDICPFFAHDTWALWVSPSIYMQFVSPFAQRQKLKK